MKPGPIFIGCEPRDDAWLGMSARLLDAVRAGRTTVTRHIVSFGYGQALGVPDADLVVDCRGLHDPHEDLDLRALRGTDAIVQERVVLSRQFPGLLLVGIEFLMENPEGTLAYGCTSGHHRSVALAELLTRWLRVRLGYRVEVEHRDITTERERPVRTAGARA